MMFLLLAMLACDPPDPLPPHMGPEHSRWSRMVSTGDVRGFLVDPLEGKNGLLLLVEKIDDETRKRATTISKGPVFVVPAPVDMGKARAYFQGLKDVDTVRMICERKVCPEGLNPTR